MFSCLDNAPFEVKQESYHLPIVLQLPREVCDGQQELGGQNGCTIPMSDLSLVEAQYDGKLTRFKDTFFLKDTYIQSYINAIVCLYEKYKEASWYVVVRTSNFGREMKSMWGPRPVSAFRGKPPATNNIMSLA